MSPPRIELEQSQHPHPSTTRVFANVAIDRVVPAEHQPRENFDDDSLAALTESVREHGILEPLLVSTSDGGTFQIIAGERRWCAARDAGLEVVPVIVLDISGPGKKWLLALIENVQREDLGPMELANAIAKCLTDTGMTHAELAAQLGRGRDFIEECLAMLRLPTEVQELLENGNLNKHHARVLRGRAKEEQIRLARQAADAGLTAADLKRLAPRATSAPPRAHTEAERIYKDLSAELQDALGCRVMVQVAGNGSGRIELRWQTDVEMTRLLNALRRVAPE